MRNETEIMRDIQRAIREQLDERGISLKVVAARSGISYSSLCGYFPGNERGSTPRIPTELPITAARALCGAIPDDLLNLIAPDGWAIVRVPNGIDHDEIERACRDFTAAKGDAHHPESEAGREIGPREAETLTRKAVQLRAVA